MELVDSVDELLAHHYQEVLHTPLIQLDVRAAERKTRFPPTNHDTPNRSSQVTPQPASWKFSTMNVRAFSTQHPGVCCLQEARLTKLDRFGSARSSERNGGTLCLDGHWKRGVSVWEARSGQHKKKQRRRTTSSHRS